MGSLGIEGSLEYRVRITNTGVSVIARRLRHSFHDGRSRSRICPVFDPLERRSVTLLELLMYVTLTVIGECLN